MKIRCSALGAIMTDPRIKSEILSETCKTYLREMWIEENYQRTRDYYSKAIEKGLTNEEQAITMLSLHLGDLLIKNERRYENDFITGTPDVVDSGIVYDTKCNWDIFTYMAADLSKQYEWQLQGYMALTGCTSSRLVYCLTDTPASLIDSEVNRIMYKLQDESMREETVRQVMRNMTYDDIPATERIKIFEVGAEPERMQKVYDRIALCREYYNTLSLTGEAITA